MYNKDKIREIVEAFASGAVFGADEDTLNSYLAEIIDRDKNKLYESDGKLRPEVVPAMVERF